MKINFILTYNGEHKLKAIKSVRHVFGLGLKDAKDLIERNGQYENGIICTQLQRYAVIGVYLAAFEFSGRPPSDVLNNFSFTSIPEVVYRDDLTKFVPMLQAATSNV